MFGQREIYTIILSLVCAASVVAVKKWDLYSPWIQAIWCLPNMLLGLLIFKPWGLFG